MNSSSDDSRVDLGKIDPNFYPENDQDLKPPEEPQQPPGPMAKRVKKRIKKVDPDSITTEERRARVTDLMLKHLGLDIEPAGDDQEDNNWVP